MRVRMESMKAAYMYTPLPPTHPPTPAPNPHPDRYSVQDMGVWVCPVCVAVPCYSVSVRAFCTSVESQKLCTLARRNRLKTAC